MIVTAPQPNRTEQLIQTTFGVEYELETIMSTFLALFSMHFYGRRSFVGRKRGRDLFIFERELKNAQK